MSRAKWLLVGVAALAAGCATGSADGGDGSGEDAAGPAADATAGNTDAKGSGNGGDSASDGTIATGEDANPSGDDDATSDDAPIAKGDDAAGGNDASEADAEGANDAGEPDATTVHDAAVDATEPETGSPLDASSDANDGATETDASTAKDSGSPDANDGSTGQLDAGTDGCSPGTVTPTATTHKAPADPQTCTATQAQQFYDACIAGTGGTSCNSWQTSNATCNTCLSGNSSPTGTEWGPYVDWPVNSIVEANVGGCLLEEDYSTQANTCGDDYEYLQECEHAACDNSCSGGSLTDYQSCATAADTAACSTYYDAIINGTGPCSSTKVQNSPCYTGGTFEAAFLAIAQVMCE